jgi:6-phosphogluconolactonase
VISVHPSADAVAKAAAERFVTLAGDAVSSRGRFTVVLAGGSTPRALYKLLAAPEYRKRTPWEETIVLFGDERWVGPDDARSNYRMAKESLLEHVPIPSDNVHRMIGESRDPAEPARAYEATLRGLFAGAARPRFDLVLLGMGADGHTASLFPDTAALGESSRWVVANHVPQLEAWRITMTYPALVAARHIVFLIAGEAKAQVVAEAFGGVPHDTPYPVERVVPRNGVLEVLLDGAAASALPQ